MTTPEGNVMRYLFCGLDMDEWSALKSTVEPGVACPEMPLFGPSARSLFNQAFAASLICISRMTIVKTSASYFACALMPGTETWLYWQTADRGLLLAADAIWVFISLLSVFFLVPLNNRIIEGTADWQQKHRVWDKAHRARIAALGIAAILLIRRAGALRCTAMRCAVALLLRHAGN